MHEWPQPPSIEECMNVEPASISAIPPSVKKSEKRQKTKKNEVQTVLSEDTSSNASISLLPATNPLNLPALHLSDFVGSNPQKKNKQPNSKMLPVNDVNSLQRIFEQIQSMQQSNAQLSVNNMNSNNIINVLQQIQAPQTPQFVVRPVVNTSNIFALGQIMQLPQVQNDPNQNLLNLSNSILPSFVSRTIHSDTRTLIYCFLNYIQCNSI